MANIVLFASIAYEFVNDIRRTTVQVLFYDKINNTTMDVKVNGITTNNNIATLKASLVTVIVTPEIVIRFLRCKICRMDRG